MGNLHSTVEKVSAPPKKEKYNFFDSVCVKENRKHRHFKRKRFNFDHFRMSLGLRNMTDLYGLVVSRTKANNMV